MSAISVKVTSKNQITLPAEYVRKLNIAKHDRLRLDIQGDKLVLQPQAGLLDRMQRHWHWQKGKTSFSNGQMYDAVRESLAENNGSERNNAVD